MSLSPGDRLGAYEIIGLLGAGGMGEVYRARDTRLKRDVAIKILPEAFGNDPDRLARFQREAELLASLNHPNIAGVLGLEQRALVLELVEGETLADRIARGPIPLDDALPIAKQIAEALEAAHERGIVHRDLKPANIKITPDGKVKVLDFGLAKALEADHSSATAGLSYSPTITSPAMMTGGGVILGTAAYMSPEQARGKPVDRRTDIWAFGCVLFEMLTGKTTFDSGDSVSDAVASILKSDPDWSALPADVPPHIRALLRRCLQKDPQKRLPHIGVARLEIDEGPVESAPPSRPSELPRKRPLWRRAAPAAALALSVAVIAAAAGFYARPSPAPSIVTRFSFTLADDQQFTNLGRQVVAFSPDGSQMAYVANAQLWIRSMSNPTPSPVPGTSIEQGVVGVVFSPDGRSLAFWSAADLTIKRVAIGGGTPVTIASATRPFGLSWDSTGIEFGQGARGIMRVSADVGKPQLLASVKPGEYADGPEMLPGGDLLLFAIATGDTSDRWEKAQIVVQSLKTGERKVLVQKGSHPHYLPTGHLVYALGGVLYAVAFDLAGLRTTGAPVPIVEGVSRSEARQTGVAHFSVSQNGSLAFVPGPASLVAERSVLAIFDGKGGSKVLKVPAGSYLNPRVSVDGKYLAYGADDGKELSVWIYELSGATSPRRLTLSGNNNRFPVWSPDGQHVAFSSDREGDEAIFWQRADGTGTAERLTHAEAGTSHLPTSWARSGQLLFEAQEGAIHSLWTFSTQDRTSTRVKTLPSTFPLDAVFSPDGHWIAYQSNNQRDGDGAGQVYVQPFPGDGTRYQITRNFSTKATWSPDGKRLFYVLRAAVSGLMVAVTVATQPAFTFGNPVSLQRGWSESFTKARDGYRAYDVMPDDTGFIAPTNPGEAESSTAAAPQINVVLNWFEELKQRVPTR